MTMMNANRTCEKPNEAMLESGIPNDAIIRLYEQNDLTKFCNQFRGFHVSDEGSSIIKYRSVLKHGFWVKGNLIVKTIEGNNTFVHYVENDFERLKVVPETVSMYCAYLDAYVGDMLAIYDTENKIDCIYYVFYDDVNCKFYCRVDNTIANIDEVWYDENIGNVWERSI